MNQKNINLAIDIVQKMERILDSDKNEIIISAETIFIDSKILKQLIEEMRVNSVLKNMTATDRFLIEILAQAQVYT